MRILLTLALLAISLGTVLSADTRRPNVVLIMADDLGYETIGADGGTSYQTPVLDRLAAGGARFTHCYAQPLCTPTRVQLLTGQSNVRNYIHFGEMNPSSLTFGNLFQQAGYATCIVGKWQLGHDRDLPGKFGFDESCLWQHTRRPPRYANPGLEINGVARDFTHGEYGPDLVNRHALDFIDRKKNTPFLLYYPMILTHAPYQPTPDSAAWDPQARGERVNRRPEHFADMVAYMDKLIGRLIAKLDALGLREDTLVIFLGDNGTGRGIRSRMGDRVVVGGKGKTTASGMHVPLIVNWPGRIVAGKVISGLVDTTDFLPTMCEAAGVKLPDGRVWDGRSFLPQLLGRTGSPREWIYSWYSPRQGQDRSVREFAFNQRYKLYRNVFRSPARSGRKGGAASCQTGGRIRRSCAHPAGCVGSIQKCSPGWPGRTVEAAGDKLMKRVDRAVKKSSGDNLGPKTLGYCNGIFLRYGFFRNLGPDAPPGKRYPDNITQPEGNVFDQLRAIDIKPSEIGHIVFSHLHADHPGMDNGRNGGAAADFPNAILHVSKIGWQDNLDKREGTKWNSYVDYAFADFLVDSANRRKVRFEDNVQIFPGVRKLYLGGHSVRSQAVVLDTAGGLVILASDDIYLYRLLEEGVMPQIRTSKEKYREAVRRMVNLAVQEKGIIVPMHDPIVWDAYCKEGTHWLRALREHSDRAVRAYLKRAPKATR
jgi:arylsulfatase A